MSDDDIVWKHVPQPHICEPPDNIRHPIWRGIMGGTVRHMDEVWTCDVPTQGGYPCGQSWWCQPCDDGVLRWKRVGFIRKWMIRRRKARS